MAEERIVPGKIDDGNREEHAKHAARYEFAKSFVKNGDLVLDMACGTGYGTEMLATGPSLVKKIYGVDLSEEAVSYAKAHFQDERLEFIVKDVTEAGFPDNHFDLMILFETIEHLDKEKGKIYLEKTFRMLKDGGTLILSCPNRDTYPEGYKQNPYHIYEYSYDEIFGLVSGYYRDIDIYCQEMRYFNRAYKKTAQLFKHLPAALVTALKEKARRALERTHDLRGLNVFSRLLLYEKFFGYDVFPFVEDYQKMKPVGLTFVCKGRISR